jgi:NAD(P)H-nitrite reductase large subunit
VVYEGKGISVETLNKESRGEQALGMLKTKGLVAATEAVDELKGDPTALSSRDLQEKDSEDEDDMVICRCEEITRGEIKEAVRNGMKTLNGIKRVTRAGMGLCQGQTCQRLVTEILAGELGTVPAKINQTTPRAPVRPVRISVLASG